MEGDKMLVVVVKLHMLDFLMVVLKLVHNHMLAFLVVKMVVESLDKVDEDTVD